MMIQSDGAPDKSGLPPHSKFRLLPLAVLYLALPVAVQWYTTPELSNMADTSRFTIICPCCEATLNIDANTGALLSHEEKQKPLASFEGLVKDLDKQKQTREQLFAQEMSSMKDRERLLEEKFREAMKRAEKDKDKVYKNPLDLD